MKKLLSILAVLAIVCTCCIMGVGTALAAPAESSAEDFLVYDGVLEEYVGTGGDIVIPASLGVNEIASRAFYQNTDIISVVIPEGVRKIGDAAFCNCENLASVTLPYSLEELQQHEFSRCAITELTIPGNCETVSYGCFSSCTYLTKLTISYGVKDIMPLAFQGTSIEKVVFPETVELICGYASFGNNKNAEQGTIEYYICNPDCEIGKCATTIPMALKKQWDKVETPWTHNKLPAQFRVYVVEGSEVDKFLTEQGQALLDAQEANNDKLKIIRKDEQFFKDLPENKEGYGTPEPSTNIGNNPGTDPSNPGTDPSNPGTGTTNPGNNSNGQNGTVQYVTEEGNSTTLIIIISVIGGVMLLAIITVVILAATGVLFGKKNTAGKNNVDPEALAAALAMLQNGTVETTQEEASEETQSESEE